MLSRASYSNQARVHNGYHYPRSFTTAFRSRINLPLFVSDYQCAVKRDFTKLYAIARRNSKVTARQFVRFCHEIGARLEPAPELLKTLFEPRLVEDAFLVEEFAFDAKELAAMAYDELNKFEIELRMDHPVADIRRLAGIDAMEITCHDKHGCSRSVKARYVFNCTYSGLNQIGGDFPGTQRKLKHEITEMALLEVPTVLQGLGITLMDGPFFSLMPFPPRRLHTLSHVRYTPHVYWFDKVGLNPYMRLENYSRQSRVARMLRDTGRFMPPIGEARYVESLFEVKTVLVKNESDDGRPILFEKHLSLPNCYSILGGKIDNIYDVLEKLDRESLSIR